MKTAVFELPGIQYPVIQECCRKFREIRAEKIFFLEEKQKEQEKTRNYNDKSDIDLQKNFLYATMEKKYRRFFYGGKSKKSR